MALITRLGPKDAARASRMFAAILDEDWLPDGPPALDRIESALADAAHVFCVAQVEDEHQRVSDIGFAMAFRLRSPVKPHDEAYLDDIFVAESHRGQGIGRELVAAVKQAMAQSGVPVLWVATDADNEPMTGLMDNEDGSERTDDVVHYAVGLPVPAPASPSAPQRGRA